MAAVAAHFRVFQKVIKPEWKFESIICGTLEKKQLPQSVRLWICIVLAQAWANYGSRAICGPL